MKKISLFNWFLALMPMSAVSIAATGSSVTVYDIPAQEIRKLSYFVMVPDVEYSFLTPLAGLLIIAASVLALVLVFGKKQGCAVWLKWISLVAACVAVAPILLKGDILVVPNFVPPLLMLAEYILCLVASKSQTAVSREPRGGRL